MQFTHSLNAPLVSTLEPIKVRNWFQNFDVKMQLAPLHVGGAVGVYSRTLKLHDCDESTRAFYVREMSRTLAEMAPCPLPEVGTGRIMPRGNLPKITCSDAAPMLAKAPKRQKSTQKYMI
jgi:hypothetical protein